MPLLSLFLTTSTRNPGSSRLLLLARSVCTCRCFHRASASSVSSSTNVHNVVEPQKPEPPADVHRQLRTQTPKYVHFWRLIRADKPIGSWLLFWPCAWSIALSSSSMGSLLDLRLIALFGAGAFLMRSAGCVLNDLWDRDIDRRVERTKSRPIASGAVTEPEAVAVLATLLSASLLILFQLNWLSIALGSSSVLLVALYPFAKRYTNWPQLVLGLTFNWGALLGQTATMGHFAPALCVPLYAACVCWTLVYDTIYAHQDKRDDLLIGLGSTALRFGDHTRAWLSAFSTGMIANLALAGVATEQLWPFYSALSVAAAHLCWQLATLRTEETADCWAKFHSNHWLGAVIFGGILASNVLRRGGKDGGGSDQQDQDDEDRRAMIDPRMLSINFYT